MFSFSQKIFITYMTLFFAFLLLMIPFSNRIIQSITNKAMEDQASALIENISSAKNNESIIRILKDLKNTIFFRVSVITDERKVLYDSHTKRLIGSRFNQDYAVNHPEVLKAFKKGVGFSEDYSELLSQKFSYLAKSFDFHGKPYVLRIAFPFDYFKDLKNDLKNGFIAVATLILLLFSLMTWGLIHTLTKPIQKIIDLIKPYQEGRENTLPEIKLEGALGSHEFSKLAITLNSMSVKIKNQINVLTKERDLTETVLESLLEGVIAIDEKMRVTYINQMAIQLIGFSRDSLLGKKFLQQDQKECYDLLVECQKSQKILKKTLQIKNDEQKLDLDLVASPTKDKLGAILVIQDQTAHHKLLEMRKDFVANASHELKTPLTIIQGFAEALEDNPDLPKEARIEIASKILRHSKRMNHIIVDLLILSDVESIPDSRLQSINLLEILNKCILHVKELYSNAEIELKSPEEKITLIGDPYLLEVAFHNLIENGAKYSKNNPHLKIEIEKLNERILIQISDQGIGIPKEDLEHIFERFYTVDKAHSRKLGGSGLGLSIVENIVHKHLGTITVSSIVGKGTTFTIQLPSN